MSLLKRTAGNGTPANQNQGPQPPQNSGSSAGGNAPAAAPPAGSNAGNGAAGSGTSGNPFAQASSGNSPFGGGSQRPSNNRPGTSSNSPRFGAGNGVNQRSWTMLPMHKTLVRFELKGLGDPFFRLLGHELNPEFGDYRRVTAELERGGEAVRALEDLLNQSWNSYGLQGAMLVYPWNENLWKGIATPAAARPESSDEETISHTAVLPAVTYARLRAIDLSLVINVLARSRSQVLMTRAPLVFSSGYLNRSLVTDDPRLVELIRATGYLEESQG